MTTMITFLPELQTAVTWLLSAAFRAYLAADIYFSGKAASATLMVKPAAHHATEQTGPFSFRIYSGATATHGLA